MIKKIVKQVLYSLGFELRRIRKEQAVKGALRPIPEGSKIYIGCGEDRREGYYGCDLRALPTVDIVCKAWEISRHVKDAAEIYARHMLEHLTLAEVQCTLDNWFSALAIGGKICIIVPNLEYHIKQWNKAIWDSEALINTQSDARYGFAGFYGWQRECDPRVSNYNTTYWDVHKSGYGIKNLEYLLKKAGFSHVHIRVVDEVHLEATAQKLINKGERQVTPFLNEIRADHRGRYLLAMKPLLAGKILDVACGIGYGTQMLAAKYPDCQVYGVDIHEGAIAYAQEYYTAPNVTFMAADAMMLAFDFLFDTIISFETIEHLTAPDLFVHKMFDLLKPGGRFILSTPNQEVMPFSVAAFPYHVRHFTKHELGNVLSAAGFAVDSWYSQHDQNSLAAEFDANGRFLIVIAQKP